MPTVVTAVALQFCRRPGVREAITFATRSCTHHRQLVRSNLIRRRWRPGYFAYFHLPHVHCSGSDVLVVNPANARKLPTLFWKCTPVFQVRRAIFNVRRRLHAVARDEQQHHLREQVGLVAVDWPLLDCDVAAAGPSVRHYTVPKPPRSRGSKLLDCVVAAARPLSNTTPTSTKNGAKRKRNLLLTKSAAKPTEPSLPWD